MSGNDVAEAVHPSPSNGVRNRSVRGVQSEASSMGLTHTEGGTPRGTPVTAIPLPPTPPSEPVARPNRVSGYSSSPIGKDNRDSTKSAGSHVSRAAQRLLPVVEAQAESYAPGVVPYLQGASPYLLQLADLLDLAGPYILAAAKFCYTLYKAAPTDIIYALLGLGLCFFGGSFVTTIAALEAFKLCGWDRCWAHFRYLWADYRIMRAKEKRRLIQAQREGKSVESTLPTADDIMFSTDLTISQRLALFAQCIQEPEKLSAAMGGLYTAMLGVMTTLRLQFARTVALGASIANMLKKPAEKHLLDRLKEWLPPKYKQWAPTLIQWFCRFIAITCAWYVQKVISAVQSALRGGLLCSRRSLSFARKRGIVPEVAKDSMVDDYVGYIIAAAGLYAQLRFSFAIPFPLNVVLAPVAMLEWWLQWFM